MKDDQVLYQFSQPHLYISLQKVGRMYFLNLGVKGLKAEEMASILPPSPESRVE